MPDDALLLRARRLPGATVLGLVAALASHAVLFGGEHAWGGTYNSVLLELTLTGLAGLAAAAGALLWSGSRCAADGTVLAVRMRELLPGSAAVAAAGAAWFALGECLESAHAGVPLLAIAVTLALASWLVLRCASVALRALAEFVFIIASAIALPRRQNFVWRPSTTPVQGFAQDDKLWRRRFTRPPPVPANA